MTIILIVAIFVFVSIGAVGIATLPKREQVQHINSPRDVVLVLEGEGWSEEFFFGHKAAAEAHRQHIKDQERPWGIPPKFTLISG